MLGYVGMIAWKTLEDMKYCCALNPMKLQGAAWESAAWILTCAQPSTRNCRLKGADIFKDFVERTDVHRLSKIE